MAAKEFTSGLAALIIGGVVVALLLQHRAQTQMREENESLRRRITQLQSDNENLSRRRIQDRTWPAPRLPAPPVSVDADTKPSLTEDLPVTNLYARFKDSRPKLTAGQVEAYLKANGRKASTLLAAYRSTGGAALLKEAMEKYPNDPQVAFEAVFETGLSPDEQRSWLDRMEKSAPDNALANYLSAFNYFRSGRTDQGIQQLVAASGKSQFEDFTQQRMQDDDEAYLSAGYSAAEAEKISIGWLNVPQLQQVKQLGRDLAALADAYIQSGDQASAQAVLQMGLTLGQRYGNDSASPALISHLTGLAVERLSLEVMDPASPYGGNGQTVQDRLNQIAQHRETIQQVADQAEPLMPNLSDQDWINYETRRRLFGEFAAMQWVVNKFGPR